MNDNQLAQMAISAILRCSQNINIFELSDVLCGKHSSEIKRKSFDTIKTFGAGKNYTRISWHYWIIQLIQQEVISIDYDDFGNLKILDKGYQILKGELEVTLKSIPLSPLSITRNGVTISIAPAIKTVQRKVKC